MRLFSHGTAVEHVPLSLLGAKTFRDRGLVGAKVVQDFGGARESKALIVTSTRVLTSDSI